MVANGCDGGVWVRSSERQGRVRKLKERKRGVCEEGENERKPTTHAVMTEMMQPGSLPGSLSN